MNSEQSLEGLWQRLQAILHPADLHPSKKTLSPASLSPRLRHVPLGPQRKPRLRNFNLTEEELKYGLPIEKYSSLLITDRPYQTHILLNEFKVLSEKLKLFVEGLSVLLTQEKRLQRFEQLEAEEQTDFNTKLERTLGRLRELLDYMKRAAYDEHMKRARTFATLPSPALIVGEPQAFVENAGYFVATAKDFQMVASDYGKRVKVQRHQTLTLEACQKLLKLISQVRLSLGYLIAESTSHDEFLHRKVTFTQKLMALGSWSPRRRFVDPMDLDTKDFALHMIEQKSARSFTPLRDDSPKTERTRANVEEDKYSNMSHLYLEATWRKGQNLKRPSSKCRFTRENRAERVLDRALNSPNSTIANSVRQLMAKFQPPPKKIPTS